jgi:hypothetical protein
LTGLLALILIAQTDLPAEGLPVVSCILGEPVTLSYPVPEGWDPLPIESDTTAWTITSQDGGRVTVIPLALDTLRLPPMRVSADTLFADVYPPLLLVGRTMPDTVWTVAPFPAPVTILLPPGFPSDYLSRHAFWEDWGAPGPLRWLLPAALAAAVVLAAALLAWRRRHRAGPLESGVNASDAGKRLSPEEEALALMETPAFAVGDWPVYYLDVERLLRSTAALRFGTSNPALTWRQMERMIRGKEGGGQFLAASETLAREIALQRYASWGGSRERARKHTLLLAGIRRDWHR